MLGSLPILPLPAPPLDGNLGPLPPAQVTELSNGSDDLNNENNNEPYSVPETVATHTRTIGIIHPPPDIRTIVDGTAFFVGKNGPGFVKMIVAKNVGNTNFNFLNVSDPYHAYYQHRLTEVRAQSQAPTQQPAPPSQSADSSAPEAAADEREGEGKLDPSAQFRPVRKVLEPPEAEQYTVRLPEGITEEEVDIIKLTAQFVARNGRSFLIGLTSRELNNPQFHFLQPTHSMFTFFTSLADAYSKVLMPPKGLTEKLKKGIVDRTTVLERCLHRLEWERSQEQTRQKEEYEVEQERMQMAMIDWHDFVVVETIDFANDEDDEIPAPMTLEEVVRRSKLSVAMEVEEEVVVEMEMEMDEEEVQLVEQGMRAANLDEENEMQTEIKSLTEDDPPMRIVKNWKRPEERVFVERDAMKYVKSPITGELIPINEMSEHMRISLIDPKYMDQKERMYAKIRETTLAQDDEISKNIVGLARLRPDIFGTTEEEVSNAVKAEIEKKKDEQPKQVIWEDICDPTNGNLPGPAASLPPRPNIMPLLGPLPPPPVIFSRVPPVQMMQLGQHPQPQMSYYLGQQHFMINRTLPMNPNDASQFTPISAPRFFIPMPPQHGMMPPPPPEEALPPLPEEPEPKRQRLKDSVLIPEDQFLAQHPSPVRVSISVPNVDEGNLKGELLEIMVQSLSETVGSLKEKIAGETQLPSNKQKLSGKAGFLKDNLSLAYYNVTEGDTLALSLRERGGRKR